MNTKRLLVALLAFAWVMFLVGLTPVESLAKEKFEEKFEKTVSLAKDGKVILSNVSGDIAVKTWDKAEVSIKALKVSKTDSEEQAKKNFEKVKIEITQDGQILRIETKYDKDFFKKKNRNVSVDYWLTIPGKADANIKSVSGDVAMEKIGGAAKGTSVSGDVALDGITGSVKGKSVSGDVTVTNAENGVGCESVSGDVEVLNAMGGADVKSVSGDVTVKKCKGDIEAEAVSGDIMLTNVAEAAEVKAKTVSGEVEYSGDIARDGSYSMHSLSGDVVMTIPADSAFDLSAKTFSGGIDSDFEIKMSGKLSKKELKGTVNGGGAEIEIKTFSGSIHLKKS
jgi:hypothetical protein